jgi:hypothetical protein
MNNPSSSKFKYTGLCMALGLVLGGLLGLIVGNSIIFAGGGLVLGMAIGAALDNRRNDH